MKQFYRKPFALYFILIIQILFSYQSKARPKSSETYWQTTTIKSDAIIWENKLNLTHYKLFSLDFNALKNALTNAPKRNTKDQLSNTIVSFPDADGALEQFRIYETSNMEPELAAMYPEIKAYVGKSISDPSAIMYFSMSPLGLQTMLLSADRPAIIIEPYTKDQSAYAVYRKNDKTASLNPFECRLAFAASESVAASATALRPNADDATYRSFRLALSVTGEYTTYFGGTVALALAAMNNSMTRVNGVFEIDFCIHMNMIANEAAIIYTNAATDPYSAAAAGAAGAWNQELQTNLTNTIGSANYDIGHLFGASGGGGNAGCIACVCVDPTGPNSLKKGSGFTSPADGIPSGDNFDIDYVAHEMGHQFGGNHTFTHSNEGTIAQVEPGSASTIMGYAGITGATDVQAHSDAYFHAVSIQQITNYVKTTTCQVNTATGNSIPTANAGLDYTIPKGTPFALTGVGTDANSDPLTYCWEQMDVGGPSTTYPSVTATSGPAFRSYTPTTDPVRYFPKLDSIKAGLTAWKWEAVPNVARTMNFRFTVRDNHAGGPANNSDDMIVTVSSASGPFVVTAPNTAVTWTGGTTQTVTWNVASTTAAPVSCANVKISLSIDGGTTFPIVISASTLNDGTEAITVPNNPTTQARIKVEAVGNIFFDMSNVNFTIIGGSTILTSIITQPIASSNICAGSTMGVAFNTDGPANSGNVFTAQLSNAAGSFASPVNIGTLSGTASGTINATIPGGTTAGTGYRIRVVSSNPAVTGSDNGTNISIFGVPASAGTVAGSATVCQGQTGVIYSVASIANATGYSWTLPTGATITSGTNTNSITVSFSTSATSGNVSVIGTNAGCNGTSSPNFAVTVNPLPSAAGTITGTATVCQNQTGVIYSVASIANATGYNWTLPTGATITSGTNTNSITVSFSASAVSGNITVAGTNSCGSGTASAAFYVTVNPAPTATVISAGGSTTFCTGGSVNLSYTPVGGVNYQWRKDGINIGAAITTPYSAAASGSYDVVATLATVGQQTFSNTTAKSIPDNTCTNPAIDSITVSGYSGAVASSAITITINITHTWDADLDMILEAPNGNKLGLAYHVGSSADNFTNTVFSDAGATVIPATGAPYTGTYKPWASTFTGCVTSTITSFASIGGGSINPNGVWKLHVHDGAGQDVGTIQNWSITFPASTPSVCTSTSNIIVVTVNSPPTITGFAPPSGTAGNSVIISGTNFSTATSVKFNGVSAAFVINNNTQITATVPAGATTGLISVTNPCGTANSASSFTITSSTVTLNLKVFIEGFYQGSGLMVAVADPAGHPTLCDTLTVELHNGTSPYNLAYSLKGTIGTNGNGSFVFPAAASGNSYYIAILTRNGMETWSKNTVLFSSPSISFDFTTP